MPVRKLCTALLAICAMAASVSALAWEDDVHYGLTWWLALKVGFTEEQAGWIASGDQGVDDSNVTGSVISTALSSCVAAEASGAATVAKNHFPSRVLPPSPAASRVVLKGEPWWETTRAAFPNVDKTEPTLSSLGRYLHSLQDSWSHQGKPDIPYSCDEKFAWGHALARGGWSCHLADLTYKWAAGDDSDAMSMAKATYDALAKAYGKKPKESWKSVKAQVATFAKLDDKFRKSQWLETHGVKNHRDVAYATSLKNCPDKQDKCYFDYALEEARKFWDARRGKLPPTPPGAPKGMTDLLQKVGDAMTQGDEKTLRTLIDSELAQLSIDRSLRINDSCARIYEEQFKWSFLEPFLSAKGAQHPVSMCELAMQIEANEKPGLACSVVTSEAIKAYAAARPRGVDLRLLRDKMGSALKGLFVFTNFRKARDNEVVAQYWALGYFAHLPQDRLLLGVSKKGDAYKVTAFGWEPDE